MGRKIDFTNPTVWTYAPMWGYVYNRTVHSLSEIGDTFSLRGLAEPRTIGKELLPIPIGTWERIVLRPPGCGRFKVRLSMP